LACRRRTKPSGLGVFDFPLRFTGHTMIQRRTLQLPSDYAHWTLIEADPTGSRAAQRLCTCSILRTDDPLGLMGWGGRESPWTRRAQEMLAIQPRASLDKAGF
jgi:hypothetical protein